MTEKELAKSKAKTARFNGEYCDCCCEWGDRDYCDYYEIALVEKDKAKWKETIEIFRCNECIKENK